MEENMPLENITPEPVVLPETPVNTPVNSVFDQKKNPWVKIAILLIVILLVCAGLVFAGMEIQKKQANTQPALTSEAVVTPTLGIAASWTTYTNPTFGYSIKFPDTYEIPPQTEKQQSQQGRDNNMCIALRGEAIKDSTTCLLVIDHWQETIDEVIKMKLPTDGSRPQDYAIGIIKGKILVYKMGESTTQAVIVLPKPNITDEIITLTYTNLPDDVETSRLIDQILSTFKFIE